MIFQDTPYALAFYFNLTLNGLILLIWNNKCKQVHELKKLLKKGNNNI